MGIGCVGWDGIGLSDSGHVRMVHSHAYYREETVAYKEGQIPYARNEAW